MGILRFLLSDQVIYMAGSVQQLGPQALKLFSVLSHKCTGFAHEIRKKAKTKQKQHIGNSGILKTF